MDVACARPLEPKFPIMFIFWSPGPSSWEPVIEERCTGPGQERLWLEVGLVLLFELQGSGTQCKVIWGEQWGFSVCLQSIVLRDLWVVSLQKSCLREHQRYDTHKSCIPLSLDHDALSDIQATLHICYLVSRVRGMVLMQRASFSSSAES